LRLNTDFFGVYFEFVLRIIDLRIASAQGSQRGLGDESLQIGATVPNTSGSKLPKKLIMRRGFPFAGVDAEDFLPGCLVGQWEKQLSVKTPWTAKGPVKRVLHEQ